MMDGSTPSRRPRQCAGPDCDTEFAPKNDQHTHCSDNCRKRHYRQRERRRRAEFVAGYLLTPARIADALEEYDRLKDEGET